MRAVDYTTERTRSIPLTVIDGRHGAGKSTLVRHAMRAANGRRVTAVVRGIESLVANDSDVKHAGSVAIWPNGSMSIETDDPTATLAMLARREDPPDHVLVEAEGPANARRISGYGYMPGYRPDGLITVVDATTAGASDRDAITDDPFIASLRMADVVVLNKADLAGKETTLATQRLVESFAPQARFVWCTGGRVALPLLLGDAGLRAPEDRTVVATWDPDYPGVRDREAHSLVGEHCRCWCILSDQPIPAGEFRRWVARLPRFILRASGSVYIQEEPQHRHELSLIGMRWVLSRGKPWAAEVPSTRITIVGTDGSRGESARLIRRAQSQLVAHAPGVTP